MYWASGPGPGPWPGTRAGARDPGRDAGQWAQDPGHWGRDPGQYVRYCVRTYRTVLCMVMRIYIYSLIKTCLWTNSVSHIFQTSQKPRQCAN